MNKTTKTALIIGGIVVAGGALLYFISQKPKGIFNVVGNVVNSQTRAPVKGIKALLFGEQIQLLAYSDANGIFRFKNISPGIYNVTVGTQGRSNIAITKDVDLGIFTVTPPSGEGKGTGEGQEAGGTRPPGSE